MPPGTISLLVEYSNDDDGFVTDGSHSMVLAVVIPIALSGFVIALVIGLIVWILKTTL